MDTIAALIVVLAVGGWIAVREARQRIGRILDEDGPRDRRGDDGLRDPLN